MRLAVQGVLLATKDEAAKNQDAVELPMRLDSCSLSPRERVRVRGNVASESLLRGQFFENFVP